MPGVKARGFDSFIFRVDIKCNCEGDKHRIGFAEALMAKAMGIDIMKIHIWSDVYETFLDAALDPENDEAREKHWREQGY